MEFMKFIILGIAFIITLVAIFVLYDKLTPDNVPDNLAGYFGLILKGVIAVVIAGYVALFVVSLFF